MQANEVEGFSFSLLGLSQRMRTGPVDTAFQISINYSKSVHKNNSDKKSKLK